MIRFFLLGFFLMASVVLVGFGFRGHRFHEPPFELFNDMDRQPRVNFQESNDFFPDGIGARRPIDGTIPMGFDIPEVAAADGQEPARFAFTISGDYYNTGRLGDYFGDGIPEGLEVDGALILRGQQRYDINCSVCHGLSGNGKGIASKYGIAAAANFHLPDFSDPSSSVYRPDGSFFHSITYGKNLMGGYGANITIRDRWAIIAYIRSLQAAAKAAEEPGDPVGDTPEAPSAGGSEAPADTPETNSGGNA